MDKKTIYIIGDTDPRTGRIELTDKIIGKTPYTACNYTFDHTNNSKITKKIVYYELSYDSLTWSGLLPNLLDRNSTLMIIFCLRLLGRNEGNTMQMALSTTLKEATERGIFLVFAINNCFALQDSEMDRIEAFIENSLKSIENPENIYRTNINSNRYINSPLGIDKPSNIVEFLTTCHSKVSFEHKRDLFQIMMKSEEDISSIKNIIKKEQDKHEKIMKHFGMLLDISIPNDVILSVFDYLRSDY